MDEEWTTHMYKNHLKVINMHIIETVIIKHLARHNVAFKTMKRLLQCYYEPGKKKYIII